MAIRQAGKAGMVCRPSVKEIAAKRPETNKGGREEEEKRLGIADRPWRPDRLRSRKRGLPDTSLPQPFAGTRPAAGKFPGRCGGQAWVSGCVDMAVVN
jgi:hypothetical protein